jgi:hypothetical protein
VSTVVVAGALGRFPVGGHAWADLNLILGLQDVGCDVWYLEDCGDGSWVWDWEKEELVTELGYPTAYVAACLEPHGLGDRWCYRAGDRWAGMHPEAMGDVLATADLLLVRGAPLDVWRPEYDLPSTRAYLDVDPGFTQVRLLVGEPGLVSTIARCEQLFTIAARLGATDCRVPLVGRDWVVTRPCVSLRNWPLWTDGPSSPPSMVLQWRSYRDVTLDGVEYGNKDRTFPAFLDLPLRLGRPVRAALTGGDAAMLTGRGWEVVEGWRATFSANDYASFVRSSEAEFGIAKHGYVALRAGWFSDRSVCHLASGRPVVLQDTGLADWLPLGEGVHAFDDLGGAVRALDLVREDAARQRIRARGLAEEMFSADVVLPPLLAAAVA